MEIAGEESWFNSSEAGGHYVCDPYIGLALLLSPLIVFSVYLPFCAVLGCMSYFPVSEYTIVVCLPTSHDRNLDRSVLDSL